MDVYNSRFALLFAPKGKTRWAITMPWGTHYSVPENEVSPAWRRHEDQHKKQWRRYWYVDFAVLYLYYQVRYGYTANLLEVEARAAETETA
jgi:hypothetical protein